MQLTNLQALWLLGLIPIIIIIHNLKPRQKQLEVANLFLWQRVFKERGKGFQIQQVFLRNLLLALQILMILLSTLALAKPVRFYASTGKGDVILLLDTSASMKTRTDQGQRFDQAILRAQTLIEQLPKGSRMLMIETAGEPFLRQPFTSDQHALQAALKQIQPTDTPGRLEKALYLAFSFFNPGHDDRIYLITDGAGGEFANIIQKFPNLQAFLVSGGSKNTAVTRFEFRQSLRNEAQYQIMVEVKNFGSEPVICPIQLLMEETPFYRETLSLEPLEKRLIILPYEGLISGKAVVRLESDDDLTVDNEAYAVLSPSEKIWILLATKGNFFLEKLLDGYPQFKINKTDKIDPQLWEGQIRQHDLVIVDHMSFPATSKGNLLLINSFSPSLPLKAGPRMDHPRILDWDRQNPLLAHVNLGGLNIAASTQILVDRPLKPLLEAPQGGLIYAFKQEGLRWVFFGFDLKQSDLPLRVAFPVLFSNIIQWLYPGKLQGSSAQVKSGEVFPIYFNPETEKLLVLPPEGSWQEYTVQARPFAFSGTRKVGFYKVAEGEKRRYFAVNLEDESESNIRTPASKPGSGIASPANGKGIVSQAVNIEQSLWLFFLWFVPCLILADWILWLKEH